MATARLARRRSAPRPLPPGVAPLSPGPGDLVGCDNIPAAVPVEVRIDIALERDAGVEVTTSDGRAYTWTRKQGGVRAHGVVRLGGTERRVETLALVDD